MKTAEYPKRFRDQRATFLVKFALGLPALTPSRDKLPPTQRVAQNGEEFLALEFIPPKGRPRVELRLQGAENLGEWIDLDAVPEIVKSETEGGQLMRFHDLRFLRLQVNAIE